MESPVATKHPRNIRRPGDGAKLISSNDTANFTFRGRFLDAGEACTVGYAASHKAHNALRWLIARQGYRNGEQAVVAWAVSGARVPNPCEDLLNLSDEDSLRDDAPDASVDAAVSAQPKTPPPNMGLVFGQSLRKAMDDATRKDVITAWQERKQEIVEHPFLQEKMAAGLLYHCQARLLARYLRGDLDAYPPFVIR